MEGFSDSVRSEGESRIAKGIRVCRGRACRGQIKGPSGGGLM